jgi:hypothetical protein
MKTPAQTLAESTDDDSNDTAASVVAAPIFPANFITSRLADNDQLFRLGTVAGAVPDSGVFHSPVSLSAEGSSLPGRGARRRSTSECRRRRSRPLQFQSGYKHESHRGRISMSAISQRDSRQSMNVNEIALGIELLGAMSSEHARVARRVRAQRSQRVRGRIQV